MRALFSWAVGCLGVTLTFTACGSDGFVTGNSDAAEGGMSSGDATNEPGSAGASEGGSNSTDPSGVNAGGVPGAAGTPSHGGSSGAAGATGDAGAPGDAGATGDAGAAAAAGSGGEGGDATLTMQIVGPAGGEVRSNDGEITLSIPAGALPEATPITIERLDGDASTIGPVYELKPDGLRFAKPIALTIEVPAYAAEEDFRGVRLATWQGGQWQPLTQQWIEYDPPSVGGLIEHFSRYAHVPGTPASCLCDVDATISCCDNVKGTYTAPCTCTTFNGAIWNRGTCYSTWETEYRNVWSIKTCYDNKADPPPRYCTPDWEECCKQAGGVGPIGGGTPFYPVSGGGSEACICDLGCGASIAKNDSSLNWGPINFLSCLTRKQNEGLPLTYDAAVCGPPGGVPGGTKAPGDGYCNGASSPNLVGPSGFGWFMNSADTSCSDLLCLPSPQRICASLEGTVQHKSVLGTYFNGPVNLSGYTGVSVTAEILPVGARFDMSIASGYGIRGETWELTSLPGLATYRVNFANGQLWTNDTIAFDLAYVEALDVSTPWATGGTVVANITGVQLGP